MVWDIETGKEIHRFEGHGDRMMCVQFDERKIGTFLLYWFSLFDCLPQPT